MWYSQIHVQNDDDDDVVQEDEVGRHCRYRICTVYNSTSMKWNETVAC